MIITGGENVYSAEVEAAIYSHPGVAQCAVIGQYYKRLFTFEVLLGSATHHTRRFADRMDGAPAAER